jgi:hypothetical protein
MLRFFSLLILAAAAVYLIAWVRAHPVDWRHARAWLVRESQGLYKDLRHPGAWTWKKIVRNLRRAFYFLFWVCFLILATTGFFPFLILGKPLDGVLLMVHVATAPIFAIIMASIALLWA